MNIVTHLFLLSVWRVRFLIFFTFLFLIFLFLPPFSSLRSVGVARIFSGVHFFPLAKVTTPTLQLSPSENFFTNLTSCFPWGCTYNLHPYKLRPFVSPPWGVRVYPVHPCLRILRTDPSEFRERCELSSSEAWSTAPTTNTFWCT